MARIRRYLIFTFTVSWIIMYLATRDLERGTLGGMTAAGQATAFCMLVPAAGALFAGLRFRELGWQPGFRENRKLLLFAWLFPTVSQLCGAALYFLVFPGDFDLSGAALQELNPAAWTQLREAETPYGVYLLGKILLPLISPFTAFSVLLGLGEEIGWRGFLAPELDRHFGRVKAMLLTGVIHGIWHFPLMFTGYEYGREYIGAPLLGLLALCIFTVSTCIISCTLYTRSRSIWLPALFHGAVNAVFNPYLFGGLEHTERSIFGPCDIGLIGGIPLMITAGYMLRREMLRAQSEYTSL